MKRFVGKAIEHAHNLIIGSMLLCKLKKVRFANGVGNMV